jgi:anaerobic selenocysteine-containing dehydrogenase
MKLKPGDSVEVAAGNGRVLVTARVDETVPQGVVLAPRSMGIPLNGPALLTIRAAEKMAV